MTARDELKGDLLTTADALYDAGVSDGKAQQADADAAVMQGLRADVAAAQQHAADIQAAFDAYKASHPDPEPPKPTAVLGASLGKTLPAAQTLPAVRYYKAKWSDLQPEYAKGTRVFVVSTKDTTPANTVAMVQAAPADVTFYVTTHHEPDDDIRDGGFTVAQWGAWMNAMGKALAPFPNVRFGPIHNGSFGKTGWTADEASCDKTLWDFWGMDRYCFKYEDPAKQFAEGAAFAKSLGLPLVIGECGAPRGDVAKQKTVAAQVRAWTLDPGNGAAVVCWWQSSNADHDTTLASSDVQKALLG